MSFSLTLIELKKALSAPGCPVCSLARSAAERYIRHLLWESVNDGQTRQHFLAGLGYCPEHTRLLAEGEVRRHGDALGVNIMYQNVAAVIADRLKTWTPSKLAVPNRPRARRPASVLDPAARCRVCEVSDQTAAYALKTLLEQLQSDAEDWRERYAQSDGLCLEHVRRCLDEQERYPQVAEFLRQQTLLRLERWQTDMEGYIRKHSWELRTEPLTPGERLAWKRALAFFVGPSAAWLDDLEENRSE